MLGLFGTLNLAARALQAQQTGVEVAGQNLSNISNTAYSRQRVQYQTGTPLATSVGQEGTGIEVTSIQQTRDTLLDGQIRDETATLQASIPPPARTAPPRRRASRPN
jgi:flagellar hook-associated protein 1 FlgK